MFIYLKTNYLIINYIIHLYIMIYINFIQIFKNSQLSTLNVKPLLQTPGIHLQVQLFRSKYLPDGQLHAAAPGSHPHAQLDSPITISIF